MSKIPSNRADHVLELIIFLIFSYVFWFGDLNFRLTGEATTSAEEIRAMVARDELKKLIEKDQLLLVRREGRAFQKLQERLPQFPPTFKFEHGSNEYDMKFVFDFLFEVKLLSLSSVLGDDPRGPIGYCTPSGRTPTRTSS